MHFLQRHLGGDVISDNTGNDNSLSKHVNIDLSQQSCKLKHDNDEFNINILNKINSIFDKIDSLSLNISKIPTHDENSETGINNPNHLIDLHAKKVRRTDNKYTRFHTNEYINNQDRYNRLVFLIDSKY